MLLMPVVVVVVAAVVVVPVVSGIMAVTDHHEVIRWIMISRIYARLGNAERNRVRMMMVSRTRRNHTRHRTISVTVPPHHPAAAIGEHSL
uniref:Secreted peptide n=1 Tax=Anopheles braziliensis TaxID=58242 RepID=A0A2M3ZM51_9DIPT